MTSLERLIRLLGRLFGPPRLFLILAGWILALGIWGTVARSWLPIEHRHRWEIALELRAPLYAKFDSGWYLSIIEWGYGPPPPAGKPSSHSFFPLYPLTAKILRDTFALDGFHAGLIVTYLSLFLAGSLLLRQGEQRLGRVGGWHALAFFLLFPTAFFFTAVYAESMFLLLTLLAFRETRRGRTGLAVLAGCGVGLTRAFGLVLGPALFLAALEPGSREGSNESTARRWRRAFLVGAAPVVTVFLWIYSLGIVKGEPGLYFRSLEGWHRGVGPIAGTIRWFETLRNLFISGYWKREPGILLDYGMVVLFVGLALYQLLRKHWSDAAWTACAVALPITTGLSGGIPRFFAAVYPVYFALAEMFRGRPRARLAAWVISGLLLLIASAGFVNWHWIA